MDDQPLLQKLDALLETGGDAVSSMANAAALIYHTLGNINWAGFYLFKRGELVLGPFQGQVACLRIAPTRGVCGAAFTQNRPLRVDDVSLFPGHIACDAASRSELVLPLRDASGKPIGVLDIDSASLHRFSDADEALLIKAAALIEQKLIGAMT